MSDTQNKPYVFISYAHKDASIVIPCIEAMKQKNINVWYDEGIQAGSEWPEYIAEKVVSCTKFVLFISRAYLESQNCKRELNFAISKKKDLLSVFIEDVELSPGVEMQLGTYQSIFKNRFANDVSFRDSLSSEQWFNTCKLGAAAAPSQTTTPKPQYTPPVQPQYTPPVQPQYTPPVQPRTNYQSNQSNYQQPQPAYQVYSTYDANRHNLPVKSRVLAALLAIFLGSLGIHHFYLGQKVQGVLCLIFFWTYIPSILGLFNGIGLLLMSNEKFEKKYKCRT